MKNGLIVSYMRNTLKLLSLTREMSSWHAIKLHTYDPLIQNIRKLKDEIVKNVC